MELASVYSNADEATASSELSELILFEMSISCPYFEVSW